MQDPGQTQGRVTKSGVDAEVIENKWRGLWRGSARSSGRGFR